MELYKDNNGIIRMFDGTIVYVVEIQYSHDGITDWENTFNAYTHTVQQTNKVVPGHKYMRIRHSGDEFYQAPMYINAEDGKSPEFQAAGSWLQWRLADSGSEWINLFDTSVLKGAKGDIGAQGRGLEVDKFCWYADFIFAAPSLQTLQSCNRCNTSSSTGEGLIVVSLGDGKHKILDADRIAGKYRSDDGITWVAIGTNDVGRYTRFMAEDAIGTNYLDYRDSNSEFNSKGKVYVYADNRWTELDGLATPNYMVAPNSAFPTHGKFMEGYESATIELNADNALAVKEESIGVEHFKSGTFGYGLLESTSIEVAPDEFKGFGISTYTSIADSKKHIQVDISTLVSDGLAVETLASIDGEAHQLVKVDVNDLYDNGLEVVAGLDGYDNLKVKQADAIEVDVDGVNVKSDEASLNSLDRATIRVMPTDNNTKGIQALHVHRNVANENKGLQKGASVTDALEAKVDGTSIGFDGTGSLTIPDNGVEGKHLNDNVANESKGIKVLSDKLEVKVKTGGGIGCDTDGLYLNSTSLESSTVTSLDGLTGDVTIPAPSNTAGAGIVLSKSLDVPNNEIEFALSVNKTQLLAFLDLASNAIATGDISDFAAGVTALLTSGGYIKNGDLRDTNTFQYHANFGPIWKSPDGSWFALTVTDVGDFEAKKVIV